MENGYGQDDIPPPTSNNYVIEGYILKVSQVKWSASSEQQGEPIQIVHYSGTKENT